MRERESYRRNAAATKSGTRFIRIYKRAAAFGRCSGSCSGLSTRRSTRRRSAKRRAISPCFTRATSSEIPGVFALSEKWQQHARGPPDMLQRSTVARLVTATGLRQNILFSRHYEKRMISISGERAILTSRIYFREMYDINSCWRYVYAYAHFLPRKWKVRDFGSDSQPIRLPDPLNRVHFVPNEKILH